MNKMLHALCAFGAASVATPALAQLVPTGTGTATVTNNGTTGGGSTTITFDGNVDNATVAGLSGLLTLSFGGIDASNHWLFNYTLDNTSTIDSRISGFAFNTNPDVAGGAATTGLFPDLITFHASGGQNYPNGVGSVEVCLLMRNGDGNSCTGGANGGVENDDGVLGGSFYLTFAGDTQPGAIDLNTFHVRYQSIDAPGIGDSGTGNAVPGVPEPATWAMMLLGFGAVGAAMRRDKKVALAA
jgi:hypothetical protein